MLDKLKVRPILEYVAVERLKITNAAHSEVTFAFAGPSLRKTKLAHVEIGNVELERLSEILTPPRNPDDRVELAPSELPAYREK